MGCCPFFTHCFKMDRSGFCGSVGISFLLLHRFTQQKLSESGCPATTVLLFFNLIIPLPSKNDGRLFRGPRSDAAFTESIWFLPRSHHMSCYTANWSPAARRGRSGEQPLVHAWVGLRRAEEQVVVYNCAQYCCMLRVSFCVCLLRGVQKPFILLRGCSGR